MIKIKNLTNSPLSFGPTKANPNDVVTIDEKTAIKYGRTINSLGKKGLILVKEIKG